MKLLISALSLLTIFTCQANDYGDKNCNIYVSAAQNVITGGHGNFLSAEVVVKKDLINTHFQKYQVKIINYNNSPAEDFSPSRVVDAGDRLIFVFDSYTRGIEYHGNSASVEAYISNGIDRLYDNNDKIYLTQANRWIGINKVCR